MTEVKEIQDTELTLHLETKETRTNTIRRMEEVEEEEEL